MLDMKGRVAMLQNILVPLDGSPVSETALPYAEALAARSHARLTLMRAALAPLVPSGEAQLRKLKQAEEYLEGHAVELRLRGLRVETGVPYGLSASSWIAEEVDLRLADIVVMATHDRVGPDRWLHGSVAEAVVSRGVAPVMLVRAADGMRAAESLAWQEPVLIVPLDGSELAQAAVPVALELARSLTAKLVLASVVPMAGQLVANEAGIGTYAGHSHERLIADAHAYLNAIVARVPASELVVHALVREGEPATEIALVAHEHHAVAIVMATHGRTGVARSILGSVAGKVLHCSTTLVVLIRPAELRPSEHPVPIEGLATTAQPA